MRFLAYQAQIEAFFAANRDRMLGDICRLIRIDSSRGEPLEGRPFGEGPAAALAEALRIAGELGFAARNRGNYVGTVDLNEGPKQLEILAHLDVVPAGEGWRATKPFEPLLSGERLYGRGAADDKGPAVAALYALKAVRGLNLPLPKNARLVFGTDEESGFRDMRQYFAGEPHAPMTFSPDAKFPVVNLEKGHFGGVLRADWEEIEPHGRLPRVLSVEGGERTNVVPASARAVVLGFAPREVEDFASAAGKRTGIRFAVRAEGAGVVVEAAGVPAHASTPEKGNNPVTGLLELLASMPFADTEAFRKLRAVQALFPHGDWLGRACGIAQGDEKSGGLTISLNRFRLTDAGLSCAFDSRTPLRAEKAELDAGVRGRAEAAGLTLAEERFLPPHYVPEESPFIRTLLACYERYAGRKGACLAFGGGTYVHGIANGAAFGCAMPERENHKHGADEAAFVEDLLLGGKIYAQAILELCG